MMIVKFSQHGKGKAAGVLNYLLKEKGKNGKQVPRSHARLLQGDPVLMEYLVDTVKHKSKYKSGYLSFEERANEISEENKKQIMQEFEDTIFAGLERDQYDILWVEHADKDIDEDHPVGRLELNFVIPGQELRTGKSFQPYYEPADQRRVNAWKNLVNKRVKTMDGKPLSDPNDPERKRLINRYSSFTARPTPFDMKRYSAKDIEEDDQVIANPSSKKDLEEAIKRRLQHSFEQGQVYNRKTVIGQLEQWGLRINRSKNAHSLSVTSPHVVDKNGRPLPIRLKGGMFSQDFDGQLYQPETKKGHSILYMHPINSTKRHRSDEQVWREGIRLKADYHQALYTSNKDMAMSQKESAELQPTLAVANRGGDRFYSPGM